MVNKAGRQYELRFNVLHKPFDNPKIREAVLYALDQKPFLEANVGNPRLLHAVQVAVPLRLAARHAPRAGRTSSTAMSPRRKELLKEAGYDGTPIVLLHQTDIAGHNQPRHRRQAAARGGRLQGRPAGDGLADAGRAPHQEGSARPGRLERLLHLVGLARRHEPGVGRLHQRLVRQGDVRLAVRCGDREAARRLRQGDRSGQAEGDRRAGRGAPVERDYPTFVPLGQFTVPTAMRKQHHGPADRCPPGALEHREEVDAPWRGSDTVFAGSIPALYDRYLGPLLFEPYARDTRAARSPSCSRARVLETAAGTGIVTTALAERLPASTTLVATDLNQAMIDHAATKPALERVELRQADALALPFADASFDVVVCQFGVMFFPDRVAGYREARRVLAPGGRFVLSVWDSLQHNPMTRVVVEAVARALSAEPAALPRPHAARPFRRERAPPRPRRGGLRFDRRRDGDIAEPRALGRACRDRPLPGHADARRDRGARSVAASPPTTDVAAAALRSAYGTGAIEAPMQAVVVIASK